MVERLGEAPALQNLSPPIQTALFLGALVLLPAAFAVLTPFTRIVIVLSFTRRAVTAQEIPPTMVLLGLSLFLTLFVMRDTLDELNNKAISPYLDNNLAGADALREGTAVMRKHLLRQTRKQDLALFLHLAGVKGVQTPQETPFHVLVPAYIVSELKTAFIMGFSVYVPFLLVDLVVASILTAMGMMMMPPIIISAPLKILLFVLADGWHLVTYALNLSFQ
jgi:flagellar biosynthetic protein FliP